MLHRRLVLGLAAVVITLACNGGSAAPLPGGPAKLGVIAGNNQVVTAAPLVPLPQDVVTQAVQLPNGQVALRTRVLDAVLPQKAYAQTAVTGIAGLVVCATTPDPKHALVAVVQCANTDNAGKAYFTFKSDTMAGVSTAQVAASLSTGIKVTDSVQATVQPAAVRYFQHYGGDTAVKVGDTLTVSGLVSAPHDRYNNQVTSYLTRFRRLNTDTTKTDADRIVGTKAAVRTGDYRLEIYLDSAFTSVNMHVVP